MAKVIVIGAGIIGTELCKQLTARGHTVVAQGTRSWIDIAGERIAIKRAGNIQEIGQALTPAIAQADAATIAIPNGNEGLDELAYMQLFHRHKLPIVTCAKAAHAYQYPKILELNARIGNSAAVGGGTDMLNTLRRRQLQHEDLIVYAVINGTANYVWHTMQGGGSFGGAIKIAQIMGYAEPGNEDYIAAINEELRDMCMKATIVTNVALSDGTSFVSPYDFEVVELTTRDVLRLSSPNARYRFIMTFASVEHDDEIPKSTPGSIRGRCGRWSINGGFHNVGAETLWYDWLREIGGINNGFRIHDPLSEDTGYALVGPGAGPGTTAKAMIRDLNRLLAA